MSTAEREEASKIAAALIGCVIDGDTEGAQILLGHASHQIIAQACTDLARWIAACVEGDVAEFREGLAESLRRFAAG